MVFNKSKKNYKFELYFEKLKASFFQSKKDKLIKILKDIVKFC